MKRNQKAYTGDERINKIMETFTVREVTQAERYLMNNHAAYIRKYCHKPCQGFWGKYVTLQDALRISKHVQHELDTGGEGDALDFYSVILDVMIGNYENLEDKNLM